MLNRRDLTTFGTEIPLRIDIDLPDDWTLLTDAYYLFEGARLRHNDQCQRPFDNAIDDWRTLLFAFWRWPPGFDLGACAERADAPFDELHHDVAERYGRYWEDVDNRLLHKNTRQRYFGTRMRYQQSVMPPAGEPVGIPLRIPLPPTAETEQPAKRPGRPRKNKDVTPERVFNEIPDEVIKDAKSFTSLVPRINQGLPVRLSPKTLHKKLGKPFKERRARLKSR